MDPDPGQSITFGWDFTNNGSIDSTAPNPSFTYTTNGNITARLIVTDSTGRASVANIPITVGNTAPVVTLTSPLDGQIFDFGGTVSYSVSVSDPEDGTTDCNEVVTQPALGHAQHAHPLETYRGCGGTIQTIIDSGHTSNDNLFYVVDTKYTDRGANGVARLTGGDSAILQPRHKEADHYTRQSGTSLVDVVTGQPAQGQMIGTISNGDWVSFEPINLLNVDAIRFRVASGGAGGTIELRRGSVTGPLLGSVAVANTGGWRNFVNVTADITDPGGSYELFLVFRNTAATGDLFNVDWLEFVAPGSALEVTALSLPLPAIGGTANTAVVGLANRTAASVSTTLTLAMPAGWTSAPVNVSVPANTTTNFNVAIHPVEHPDPGHARPVHGDRVGDRVERLPIRADLCRSGQRPVAHRLRLGHQPAARRLQPAVARDRLHRCGRVRLDRHEHRAVRSRQSRAGCAAARPCHLAEPGNATAQPAGGDPDHLDPSRGQQLRGPAVAHRHRHHACPQRRRHPRHGPVRLGTHHCHGRYHSGFEIQHQRRQ